MLALQANSLARSASKGCALLALRTGKDFQLGVGNALFFVLLDGEEVAGGDVIVGEQ